VAHLGHRLVGRLVHAPLALAVLLLGGAAHVRASPAAPSSAAEPSVAVAADPTVEPRAGATPKPGAISGTVTVELTGQPIEGATVLLEGTRMSTTTDASGHFRLESVVPGEYCLVVSRTGHLPARVTDVVVTANRESPANARLQRIAFGAEVAVQASAFERPVDVTTGSFRMNQEEVRRAPGALGDVNRMIQALPGVGPRDDQRNDIVARGGSPSENLTLVDGLEVPSLSHFGAQGASGGPITMLNAEAISDVQFLAGGFPACYDNRLSSVLEVGLREGSREKFEAEFDLGMAGAGLLAEGPLGKHGSWLLTGRRSYLDLIAGAYGLDAVPQYANYEAKVVYDLSARHRLSLVSLGGWDQMNYDPDVDDDDQPSNIKVESSGWRTLTGLTLRSLLGTSGFTTLSVGHVLNNYSSEAWDKDLEGQLIERNHSLEGQTTARGDLTLRLPHGGWLKAGASAKRLDATLDIQLPIGTENSFSVDATRINELAIDRHVRDWQYGAYLQLSQNLGRFVTATAGGRYDRFPINGKTLFTPRAALALHLRPNLDLSASWGRYAQNPPLAFMEADPANAELVPIRAEHYVGGLAFYPGKDLKLSVELSRRNYRDYPVSTQFPFYTLADSGEQYDLYTLLIPFVAGGSGRSTGVELFLQKKLTGRVFGQLSYAFSKTEQRALDGVWRAGGFDLPHVLSVLGGVKATRTIEISDKFSYTSGRPYTPLAPETVAENRMIFDASRYNAERGPAYHRLDLRADHRSSFRWGNIVTYVEFDNVYNRKNVRYYYWNPKKQERETVPQIAFMFIGGVNVQF
jgi:hypothetical protein